MNVCTMLETNTEKTEMMPPGMRAFNNPAVFAKATAMLGTTFGNPQLDIAIARCSSMSLGVVAAIGDSYVTLLEMLLRALGPELSLVRRWAASTSASRRGSCCMLLDSLCLRHAQ